MLDIYIILDEGAGTVVAEKTRNLGISIYPEHTLMEHDLAYISLAAKYGFTRIFTCLLSIQGDQAEIIARFKGTIEHAKKLDMQVVVDIAPNIFERLGISYQDLHFFHQLGADGIRLDLGFTGLEEALMTYNPYDLKIELNMSTGTKYLENILSYKPKIANLQGCHNFYPHRYSGLAYEHFLTCSRVFHQNGLRTAAFINSSFASFGPWPVTEGLCTLEMHRNLPIEVQAKHLFKTGLIHDVIIANSYASEEELGLLGELKLEPFTFSVSLEETITDIEKKIVLEEPHFSRGDISEYMVRSTQSRVKYKDEHFKPTYTPPIRRGDLLIDNEAYGQYKGELQIALKDMENTGKTNVVGRIAEEELFLLDLLEPWESFRFQEQRRNT